MYKYFIASRFLLEEHKDYQRRYNAAKFREIVSLDSILCKKRYFDTNTNTYIGEITSLEEIIEFPYSGNEQLIKYTSAIENFALEKDCDFEFCGFDILDYFGDNSWIVGYCIGFEPEIYDFSKYGLLGNFNDVINWINNHKTHIQELQNGEYQIFAVWRSVGN